MKILEKLDNIIDPRDEAKIDYPLSSIIFITLCAVLCKAESWKDVVLFGESKEEWLKNYIDLDVFGLNVTAQINLFKRLSFINLKLIDNAFKKEFC